MHVQETLNFTTEAVIAAGSICFTIISSLAIYILKKHDKRAEDLANRFEKSLTDLTLELKSSFKELNASIHDINVQTATKITALQTEIRFIEKDVNEIKERMKVCH